MGLLHEIAGAIGDFIFGPKYPFERRLVILIQLFYAYKKYPIIFYTSQYSASS